jgi:hypothetical protein
MPASPIASEPQLILDFDVQGGASVSESVGAKIGATSNFILNKFYVMPFGVSGAPYSGLSAYPYTFTGAAEAARLKSQIDSIFVFNEISGISGTTEFRIEKQLAAGGSWTNIFTTNCQIQNTANDNISFSNTDLVAPSGVTLPVLPTTTLEVGDKLRFVLVSAADQAQNLKVRVYLRPIN